MDNNSVKVIKKKNGVATVIEFQGKPYALQHEHQFKPKKKEKAPSK